MSRFVSGERRGTILLVIIIAAIIAVKAFVNRSRDLPQAPPPPENIATDNPDRAQYQSDNAQAKGRNGSGKKIRKKKKASSPGRQSKSRRQRDYLNEAEEPTVSTGNRPARKA